MDPKMRNKIAKLENKIKTLRMLQRNAETQKDRNEYGNDILQINMKIEILRGECNA